MAQNGEEFEIDAGMLESLIKRIFEEKGVLKRRDGLGVYRRWRGT